MKPENYQLVRRAGLSAILALFASPKRAASIAEDELEKLLEAARAEERILIANSMPVRPVVLSIEDGPVVPLRVGDRVVGYVLESEARWLALDVGTSPSMSYSVGGSIGPGAPRK